MNSMVQSIINKCKDKADSYNLWLNYNCNDDDHISLSFSCKSGIGIYPHFNIHLSITTGRCYCSSLNKWFGLNLLDSYVETLCDLIAE